MRIFTFTQVFAGRDWTVARAANFVDSVVFSEDTNSYVLGVERFDTSARRSMDISEALEQFNLDLLPEVDAFNITIAEEHVERYAAFLGRSVEEFEQEFYGEWRQL